MTCSLHPKASLLPSRPHPTPHAVDYRPHRSPEERPWPMLADTVRRWAASRLGGWGRPPGSPAGAQALGREGAMGASPPESWRWGSFCPSPASTSKCRDMERGGGGERLGRRLLAAGLRDGGVPSREPPARRHHICQEHGESGAGKLFPHTHTPGAGPSPQPAALKGAAGHQSLHPAPSLPPGGASSEQNKQGKGGPTRDGGAPGASGQLCNPWAESRHSALSPPPPSSPMVGGRCGEMFRRQAL